MKYVMAFAANHRPTLLEDGVSCETVSGECREAALMLMAGVAGGWDKIDLAGWLTGPYAHATRHFQHGERTTARTNLRESRTPISPQTIEALLTTTRTRLLAALERAALSDGTLDFADEVVLRGHVHRAIDVDGMIVWIPVDGVRMRLQDRVRALFVADYLNDPEAYSTLYVCHRCEAVVFDEAARRLGICSSHRRISGFVARNDDDNNEMSDDNVYLGNMVMLPPPPFASGDDR